MNALMQSLAARSVPFINLSGQEIPAFAVMAVTGTTVENGITFLACEQTSTTFVPSYAVNGPQRVAAGQRGACYTSGEAIALYDGGTPAAQEGWGAKPGEWKLSRGFPGPIILGVVHSGHQRARIRLSPITRLLVKTTAAIAPTSNTTSYRVYAGAMGSEADAGFTTVPTARNRLGQSLASGEWAWLTWIHDCWELHVEHNRIHPVTITAGVANGAALSVTLPDGRTVSATNVSGMALTAGSATAYQDFSSGAWYLTGARASGGGGGGSVEVTGFTIGDNLSDGTSAATDDDAAGITVLDDRELFKRALAASGSITAAEGLAIKDQDENWIVVECQSKAGWAVVTLTEPMGEDDQADANLGRFGGTQQDIQRPVSSTGITVYDEDELYKNALSGAEAIAIYDNVADKYRVVISNQRAVLALGTLGEDVEAEDAAADVTLDAALSPFPFGQTDGDVTEAVNAWGSKGKSGDAVLLVWSDADQTYYLLRPGGGGPPMYKAKLNGALAAGSSTATIDSVTAFDGGTAPSPTSASNWLAKCGPDNADCWIMEDSSGEGSPVYRLMDVKMVPLDIQLDTVDATTKLDKKRRAASVYTNDTSDTVTKIVDVTSCS